MIKSFPGFKYYDLWSEFYPSHLHQTCVLLKLENFNVRITLQAICPNPTMFSLGTTISWRHFCLCHFAWPPLNHFEEKEKRKGLTSRMLLRTQYPTEVVLVWNSLIKIIQNLPSFMQTNMTPITLIRQKVNIKIFVQIYQPLCPYSWFSGFWSRCTFYLFFFPPHFFSTFLP